VRERGFEVVSYLSRLGSCALDAELWAGEKERAAVALRRAALAGCGAIRVMGYKRGGCPGPERFVRTRERLARLTELAEAAGVVLLLETIFAPWQSVGGSAAGCLRLMESIGSPHLRVCLDPGNAAADGEDPILLVELLAPYAADVHVKDAQQFASRVAGFCLPGDGVCDWPHLLSLLRAAGYAGPFTLEPHLQHTTSHHVTGRAGFLAAADRTRELLALAGFSAEGGVGR
jgi:sugar phosphate isomerase/epimerase